jgi:ABC-type uncharacterized transport system substrate-binding protein
MMATRTAGGAGGGAGGQGKRLCFHQDLQLFTFVKIDGRPFAVKFVKDFNAILKDNRLVYEFFIPCHVTAVDTPKKLTIATYDPFYYTAIYFTE